MAAPIPFAERSSAGLLLHSGPPDFQDVPELEPVQSKACRLILFSPEGQYLAYIVGTTLNILDTTTWKQVATVKDIKAFYLTFSPKSTFLVAWEQFLVNKESPQGKPNLHIYKTETGELVTSFIHKKQGNWEPQWSADEKLFSRLVNTDVVFYEDNNFEKIVARISCCKVSSYNMSPNVGTYFVLCYTKGPPGQPAYGKLFKYPSFGEQQEVANNAFFQSDKLDVHWNAKGNNALLLASSEVDKTGSSYYGKQGLYFMTVSCRIHMVILSKEGPIYSIAWSPKSHEFCVVYGYVPARATIYNLKCEPVFEFGTGPRNCVYYNPQGNMVLLGGFGNLRGQIEVWDAVNRKLIGNSEAADTTYLEWSPDGIHFLTATTTPRLRIANGYKIWHYSGALLHEKLTPASVELYEVTWKKYPKFHFKEPSISTVKVQGIATSQPVASKQAYRPPSARNKPAIHFKLDDDEQQSHKPGTENQSKASLKQKKKREAKKAKKQEEGEGSAVPGVVSSVQIALTGDPEKDKKLKNIKKKLDAIEKLKEQQVQGKTLEINQLAKIKGEADLLVELEQLQLE